LTSKLPATSRNGSTDSHRPYRNPLLSQAADPEGTAIRGSPPERFFSLQRLQPRKPFPPQARRRHGVAKSRTGPLLAFLRFQRAGLNARSLDLPGFFHPGNALELSPSGLCSPRRFGTVSSAVPSLPFHVALGRRLRLRRFTPSERQVQPSRSPTVLYPPGVLPLEVLPFPTVEPASRILLSRASPHPGRNQRSAAPQSFAEWGTGFTLRTRRCVSGTDPSGVCHLVVFRSSEEPLPAFR
jgi:hypothetical protein